ncbi:hypothetical protein AMTRI_Chr11g153600 [Amborella trichopoda]
MKILTWNFMGLGDPKKHRHVHNFASSHSHFVLALVETKLPGPSLSLIRQVWRYRPCQRMALDALGSSGGIWVIWDPTLHNLLSSRVGKFSVSISLSRVSDSFPLKFTAVYGPNSSSIRPRLWEELNLEASVPPNSWCIGGDFNTTRWSFERNSNSMVSQSMTDFSELLSRLELIDMALLGASFTWSGLSPTLSKLDRFLISLDWDAEFPGSHSLALPKPTSDHFPIMLDTVPAIRSSKPVRFELAWLEEDNFNNLFHMWWTSFSSHVHGWAGYRLQKKLQCLKGSLKAWSALLPRNFRSQKASLLHSIQLWDSTEETRALADNERSRRAEANFELHLLLKKEEIFWAQRSRVKWLKHGDLNIGFLHKIANCRRRDNTITQIRVGYTVLDQPPLIEDAITEYLQNIF